MLEIQPQSPKLNENKVVYYPKFIFTFANIFTSSFNVFISWSEVFLTTFRQSV